MKRYIKSSNSIEDRDFDYTMFKPLIQSFTNDYFDVADELSDGEGPVYEAAIDFITAHVLDYLEDMNYESVEDLVKLYLDNNTSFKK